MKNKCNLLYSIFDESIVVSDKKIINAIQGYKVIRKARVLCFDDVVAWFRTGSLRTQWIPDSELWQFDCPSTGESWFVNNFIVAYCRGTQQSGLMPKIKMLYLENGKYLVDKLDTLEKYRLLFRHDVTTIHISLHIGYLSYPDKAIYNGGFEDVTIKLPYRI